MCTQVTVALLPDFCLWPGLIAALVAGFPASTAQYRRSTGMPMRLQAVEAAFRHSFLPQHQGTTQPVD